MSALQEFDVGTDGMLWCRYCNYVSKRGFNMRRHYQRNHLGLLAPRLVSRAELVLLPPVSEGSHSQEWRWVPWTQPQCLEPTSNCCVYPVFTLVPTIPASRRYERIALLLARILAEAEWRT
ncbi:hypothetical protein HPB47_005758 [Ixodes persulcatus]|uniref:Uncharacterized protein n=1 Tax=Ixodes persulcatus TaxID=34615 RepID=A0AC60PC68_IXOPE|nr:hypothetical protein HPB47_005758 [Ixodes persulcatus]